VRRLLADALTWSEGRFFYEASADAADTRDRQRGARTDSRWGIAVSVDLGAALEQIGRERAARPPPDECVAVADDDVIEAMPAE